MLVFIMPDKQIVMSEQFLTPITMIFKQLFMLSGFMGLQTFFSLKF